MGCCGFADAVNQQFTEAKARKELEDYRRRGVGSTTRMLLDGLAHAGLTRGRLLDIGPGVGGLTFELLSRGIDSATVVEASDAYAAAITTEASRRGASRAVQVVSGDFLDVAGSIPKADVVTLDRVVCCYPLYRELLDEALRRAGRGFAFSYPRNRWYVRAAVHGENFLRRRRCAFRTFVHPVESMRASIDSAGFTRVAHDHSLAWCADVFVRKDARRAAAAPA